MSPAIAFSHTFLCRAPLTALLLCLATACGENDEQEPSGDGTEGVGGSGGQGASGGTAGSTGSLGGQGASGAMGPEEYDNDCEVSGDFRRWHRVTVSCQGPEMSEDDATFTDRRMTVTFSQQGRDVVVPGHFAADGQASESGATSGSVWRAHFMPGALGKWAYRVSFRQGENVAVSLEPEAGQPVDDIDGMSGAFDVAETDKQGRDMRGHGLLRHGPGERYLRHEGSGQVFVEGGVDSPENLFGYDEFDDTVKHDNVGSCKGILHSFADHEQDWQSDDPTWGGGRGKSLIGLINYLATTAVNAIYLVAMSENGDGCDTYPWTSYGGDHRSFDVSKLDQWETAFAHMTARGFMIHYVTQETENDQLLSGGDLGLERKLYYREIISRFGHHPALQWNLGEENTNTTAQQKAFAEYFEALDPYQHPVVLHTYPGQKDRYDGLLGFEAFDGPTLQFGNIPENASGGLYGETRSWLEKSAKAGNTWVVTATEASGGDAPTPGDGISEKQRVYWMYAGAMAGGGGFEWYLKSGGGGHAYDLSLEDHREFSELWTQSGYFVRLFNEIIPGDGVDLQEMEPRNDATSQNNHWVLANDDAALVFLREGGSVDLALQGSGTRRVLWFDPRTGHTTEQATVQAGGEVSLGSPPSQAQEDWVLWVRP